MVRTLKLAAVLVLLLSLTFGFAQNGETTMQTIDSLNRLLERQSGSQKIQTLLSLIEQYSSLSPSKSINTGESALESGEYMRQPEVQAGILRRMASSAQFAGDMELAGEYLRRAIVLSRSSGNENLLGHMLTAWGNHLQRQGKYSEAIKVLTEALQLANKLPNDTIALKANIDLGNTAFDMGDIHQAMDYYRNTLMLATKLKDESIKARTLLNMGMANWQFDNNDLAISMLKESAALFETQNDRQNLGMVYNNLGLIYFSDKRQYDTASHYFEASLRIREQLGSPVPIAHVLVNQANLLSATNRFSEALNYFERSLQIFNSAGILSQVVRVNYHMGEAYQRMEKIGESINFFEKTLDLAQQAKLETYEDLARQKLLDLYASTGNWKAFMVQFAHFRAQHDKLLDDYNSVSIRENQLQDTLSVTIASFEALNDQNKALARRVKLLESILITIATAIGAGVLLLMARRLIFRFLPPH